MKFLVYLTGKNMHSGYRKAVKYPPRSTWLRHAELQSARNESGQRCQENKKLFLRYVGSKQNDRQT